MSLQKSKKQNGLKKAISAFVLVLSIIFTSLTFGACKLFGDTDVSSSSFDEYGNYRLSTPNLSYYPSREYYTVNMHVDGNTYSIDSTPSNNDYAAPIIPVDQVTAVDLITSKSDFLSYVTGKFGVSANKVEVSLLGELGSSAITIPGNNVAIKFTPISIDVKNGTASVNVCFVDTSLNNSVISDVATITITKDNATKTYKYNGFTICSIDSLTVNYPIYLMTSASSTTIDLTNELKNVVRTDIGADSTYTRYSAAVRFFAGNDQILSGSQASLYITIGRNGEKYYYYNGSSYKELCSDQELMYSGYKFDNKTANEAQRAIFTMLTEKTLSDSDVVSEGKIQSMYIPIRKNDAGKYELYYGDRTIALDDKKEFTDDTTGSFSFELVYYWKTNVGDGRFINKEGNTISKINSDAYDSASYYMSREGNSSTRWTELTSSNISFANYLVMVDGKQVEIKTEVDYSSLQFSGEHTLSPFSNVKVKFYYKTYILDANNKKIEVWVLADDSYISIYQEMTTGVWYVRFNPRLEKGSTSRTLKVKALVSESGDNKTRGDSYYSSGIVFNTYEQSFSSYSNNSSYINYGELNYSDKLDPVKMTGSNYYQEKRYADLSAGQILSVTNDFYFYNVTKKLDQSIGTATYRCTDLTGYFPEGRIVKVERVLLNHDYAFQSWTVNSKAENGRVYKNTIYNGVEYDNKLYIDLENKEFDLDYSLSLEKNGFYAVTPGLYRSTAKYFNGSANIGEIHNTLIWDDTDITNERGTELVISSIISSVTHASTHNYHFYANYEKVTNYTLSGSFVNGDHLFDDKNQYIEGVTVQVYKLDNVSDPNASDSSPVLDKNGAIVTFTETKGGGSGTSRTFTMNDGRNITITINGYLYEVKGLNYGEFLTFSKQTDDIEGDKYSKYDNMSLAYSFYSIKMNDRIVASVAQKVLQVQQNDDNLTGKNFYSDRTGVNLIGTKFIANSNVTVNIYVTGGEGKLQDKYKAASAKYVTSSGELVLADATDLRYEVIRTATSYVDEYGYVTTSVIIALSTDEQTSLISYNMETVSYSSEVRYISLDSSSNTFISNEYYYDKLQLKYFKKPYMAFATIKNVANSSVTEAVKGTKYTYGGNAYTISYTENGNVYYKIQDESVKLDSGVVTATLDKYLVRSGSSASNFTWQVITYEPMKNTNNSELFFKLSSISKPTGFEDTYTLAFSETYNKKANNEFTREYYKSNSGSTYVVKDKFAKTGVEQYYNFTSEFSLESGDNDKGKYFIYNEVKYSQNEDSMSSRASTVARVYGSNLENYEVTYTVEGDSTITKKSVDSSKRHTVYFYYDVKKAADGKYYFTAPLAARVSVLDVSKSETTESINHYYDALGDNFDNVAISNFDSLVGSRIFLGSEINSRKDEAQFKYFYMLLGAKIVANNYYYITPLQAADTAYISQEISSIKTKTTVYKYKIDGVSEDVDGSVITVRRTSDGTIKLYDAKDNTYSLGDYKIVDGKYFIPSQSYREIGTASVTNNYQLYLFGTNGNNLYNLDGQLFTANTLSAGLTTYKIYTLNSTIRNMFNIPSSYPDGLECFIVPNFTTTLSNESTTGTLVTNGTNLQLSVIEVIEGAKKKFTLDQITVLEIDKNSSLTAANSTITYGNSWWNEDNIKLLKNIFDIKNDKNINSRDQFEITISGSGANYYADIKYYDTNGNAKEIYQSDPKKYYNFITSTKLVSIKNGSDYDLYYIPRTIQLNVTADISTSLSTLLGTTIKQNDIALISVGEYNESTGIYEATISFSLNTTVNEKIRLKGNGTRLYLLDKLSDDANFNSASNLIEIGNDKINLGLTSANKGKNILPLLSDNADLNSVLALFEQYLMEEIHYNQKLSFTITKSTDNSVINVVQAFQKGSDESTRVFPIRYGLNFKDSYYYNRIVNTYTTTLKSAGEKSDEAKLFKVLGLSGSSFTLTVEESYDATAGTLTLKATIGSKTVDAVIYDGKLCYFKDSTYYTILRDAGVMYTVKATRNVYEQENSSNLLTRTAMLSDQSLITVLGKYIATNDPKNAQYYPTFTDLIKYIRDNGNQVSQINDIHSSNTIGAVDGAFNHYYSLDYTQKNSVIEGMPGVSLLDGPPYPNPVLYYSVRHLATEEAIINLSLRIEPAYYVEVLGTKIKTNDSDLILDFSSYTFRDTLTNLMNNDYIDNVYYVIEKSSFKSIVAYYQVDKATYNSLPETERYMDSSYQYFAMYNGGAPLNIQSVGINEGDNNIYFNDSKTSTGKYNKLVYYMINYKGSDMLVKLTQDNAIIWQSNENKMEDLPIYDIHAYEQGKDGTLYFTSGDYTDDNTVCKGLEGIAAGSTTYSSGVYDYSRVLIAGVVNVYRANIAFNTSSKDMLGYWPFDRISAINAYDSSDPFFISGKETAMLIATPIVRTNSDNYSQNFIYRFSHWMIYTRYNSEIIYLNNELTYDANGNYANTGAVLQFESKYAGYYLCMPVYERVLTISAGTQIIDGSNNLGGNVTYRFKNGQSINADTQRDYQMYVFEYYKTQFGNKYGYFYSEIEVTPYVVFPGLTSMSESGWVATNYDENNHPTRWVYEPQFAYKDHYTIFKVDTGNSYLYFYYDGNSFNIVNNENLMLLNSDTNDSAPIVNKSGSNYTFTNDVWVLPIEITSLGYKLRYQTISRTATYNETTGYSPYSYSEISTTKTFYYTDTSSETSKYLSYSYNTNFLTDSVQQNIENNLNSVGMFAYLDYTSNKLYSVSIQTIASAYQSKRLSVADIKKGDMFAGAFDKTFTFVPTIKSVLSGDGYYSNNVNNLLAGELYQDADGNINTLLKYKSAYFDRDTRVIMTASPDYGYRFEGWYMAHYDEKSGTWILDNKKLTDATSTYTDEYIPAIYNSAEDKYYYITTFSKGKVEVVNGEYVYPKFYYDKDHNKEAIVPNNMLNKVRGTFINQNNRYVQVYENSLYGEYYYDAEFTKPVGGGRTLDVYTLTYYELADRAYTIKNDTAAYNKRYSAIDTSRGITNFDNIVAFKGPDKSYNVNGVMFNRYYRIRENGNIYVDGNTITISRLHSNMRFVAKFIENYKLNTVAEASDTESGITVLDIYYYNTDAINNDRSTLFVRTDEYGNDLTATDKTTQNINTYGEKLYLYNKNSRSSGGSDKQAELKSIINIAGNYHGGNVYSTLLDHIAPSNGATYWISHESNGDLVNKNMYFDTNTTAIFIVRVARGQEFNIHTLGYGSTQFNVEPIVSPTDEYVKKNVEGSIEDKVDFFYYIFKITFDRNINVGTDANRQETNVAMDTTYNDNAHLVRHPYRAQSIVSDIMAGKAKTYEYYSQYFNLIDNNGKYVSDYITLNASKGAFNLKEWRIVSSVLGDRITKEAYNKVQVATANYTSVEAILQELSKQVKNDHAFFVAGVSTKVVKGYKPANRAEGYEEINDLFGSNSVAIADPEPGKRAVSDMNAIYECVKYIIRNSHITNYKYVGPFVGGFINYFNLTGLRIYMLNIQSVVIEGEDKSGATQYGPNPPSLSGTIYTSGGMNGKTFIDGIDEVNLSTPIFYPNASNIGKMSFTKKYGINSPLDSSGNAITTQTGDLSMVENTLVLFEGLLVNGTMEDYLKELEDKGIYFMGWYEAKCNEKTIDVGGGIKKIVREWSDFVLMSTDMNRPYVTHMTADTSIVSLFKKVKNISFTFDASLVNVTMNCTQIDGTPFNVEINGDIGTISGKIAADQQINMTISPAGGARFEFDTSRGILFDKYKANADGTVMVDANGKNVIDNDFEIYCKQIFDYKGKEIEKNDGGGFITRDTKNDLTYLAYNDVAHVTLDMTQFNIYENNKELTTDKIINFTLRMKRIIAVYVDIANFTIDSSNEYPVDVKFARAGDNKTYLTSVDCKKTIVTKNQFKLSALDDTNCKIVHSLASNNLTFFGYFDIDAEAPTISYKIKNTTTTQFHAFYINNYMDEDTASISGLHTTKGGFVNFAIKYKYDANDNDDKMFTYLNDDNKFALRDDNLLYHLKAYIETQNTVEINIKTAETYNSNALTKVNNSSAPNIYLSYNGIRWFDKNAASHNNNGSLIIYNGSSYRDDGSEKNSEFYFGTSNGVETTGSLYLDNLSFVMGGKVYIFAGWFDKDNNFISNNNEATIYNLTTSYYAKFVKAYKVTIKNADNFNGAGYYDLFNTSIARTNNSQSRTYNIETIATIGTDIYKMRGTTLELGVTPLIHYYPTSLTLTGGKTGTMKSNDDKYFITKEDWNKRIEFKPIESTESINSDVTITINYSDTYEFTISDLLYDDRDLNGTSTNLRFNLSVTYNSHNHSNIEVNNFINNTEKEKENKTLYFVKGANVKLYVPSFTINRQYFCVYVKVNNKLLQNTNNYVEIKNVSEDTTVIFDLVKAVNIQHISTLSGSGDSLSLVSNALKLKYLSENWKTTTATLNANDSVYVPAGTIVNAKLQDPDSNKNYYIGTRVNSNSNSSDPFYTYSKSYSIKASDNTKLISIHTKYENYEIYFDINLRNEDKSVQDIYKNFKYIVTYTDLYGVQTKMIISDALKDKKSFTFKVKAGMTVENIDGQFRPLSLTTLIDDKYTETYTNYIVRGDFSTNVKLVGVNNLTVSVETDEVYNQNGQEPVSVTYNGADKNTSNQVLNQINIRYESLSTTGEGPNGEGPKLVARKMVGYTFIGWYINGELVSTTNELTNPSASEYSYTMRQLSYHDKVSSLAVAKYISTRNITVKRNVDYSDSTNDNFKIHYSSIILESAKDNKFSSATDVIKNSEPKLLGTKSSVNFIIAAKSKILLVAESYDGYYFDGWYRTIGDTTIRVSDTYHYQFTDVLNEEYSGNNAVIYEARYYKQYAINTVTQFINDYSDETIVSSDPITITCDANDKIIPDGVTNFYTEKEFGPSSNKTNYDITATATDVGGYYFIGWFVNGTYISNSGNKNLTLTYTIYHSDLHKNVIIEARYAKNINIEIRLAVNDTNIQQEVDDYIKPSEYLDALKIKYKVTNYSIDKNVEFDTNQKVLVKTYTIPFGTYITLNANDKLGEYKFQGNYIYDGEQSSTSTSVYTYNNTYSFVADRDLKFIFKYRDKTTYSYDLVKKYELIDHTGTTVLDASKAPTNLSNNKFTYNSNEYKFIGWYQEIRNSSRPSTYVKLSNNYNYSFTSRDVSNATARFVRIYNIEYKVSYDSKLTNKNFRFDITTNNYYYSVDDINSLITSYSSYINYSVGSDNIIKFSMLVGSYAIDSTTFSGFTNDKSDAVPVTKFDEIKSSTTDNKIYENTIVRFAFDVKYKLVDNVYTDITVTNVKSNTNLERTENTYSSVNYTITLNGNAEYTVIYKNLFTKDNNSSTVVTLNSSSPITFTLNLHGIITFFVTKRDSLNNHLTNINVNGEEITYLFTEFKDLEGKDATNNIRYSSMYQLIQRDAAIADNTIEINYADKFNVIVGNEYSNELNGSVSAVKNSDILTKIYITANEGYAISHIMIRKQSERSYSLLTSSNDVIYIFSADNYNNSSFGTSVNNAISSIITTLKTTEDIYIIPYFVRIGSISFTSKPVNSSDAKQEKYFYYFTETDRDKSTTWNGADMHTTSTLLASGNVTESKIKEILDSSNAGSTMRTIFDTASEEYVSYTYNGLDRDINGSALLFTIPIAVNYSFDVYQIFTKYSKFITYQLIVHVDNEFDLDTSNIKAQIDEYTMKSGGYGEYKTVTLNSTARSNTEIVFEIKTFHLSKILAVRVFEDKTGLKDFKLLGYTNNSDISAENIVYLTTNDSIILSDGLLFNEDTDAGNATNVGTSPDNKNYTLYANFAAVLVYVAMRYEDGAILNTDANNFVASDIDGKKIKYDEESLTFRYPINQSFEFKVSISEKFVGHNNVLTNGTVYDLDLGEGNRLRFTYFVNGNNDKIDRLYQPDQRYNKTLTLNTADIKADTTIYARTTSLYEIGNEINPLEGTNAGDSNTYTSSLEVRAADGWKDIVSYPYFEPGTIVRSTIRANGLVIKAISKDVTGLSNSIDILNFINTTNGEDNWYIYQHEYTLENHTKISADFNKERDREYFVTIATARHGYSYEFKDDKAQKAYDYTAFSYENGEYQYKYFSMTFRTATKKQVEHVATTKNITKVYEKADNSSNVVAEIAAGTNIQLLFGKIVSSDFVKIMVVDGDGNTIIGYALYSDLENDSWGNATLSIILKARTLKIIIDKNYKSNEELQIYSGISAFALPGGKKITYEYYKENEYISKFDTEDTISKLIQYYTKALQNNTYNASFITYFNHVVVSDMAMLTKNLEENYFKILKDEKGNNLEITKNIKWRTTDSKFKDSSGKEQPSLRDRLAALGENDASTVNTAKVKNGTLANIKLDYRQSLIYNAYTDLIKKNQFVTVANSTHNSGKQIKDVDGNIIEGFEKMSTTVTFTARNIDYLFFKGFFYLSNGYYKPLTNYIANISNNEVLNSTTGKVDYANTLYTLTQVRGIDGKLYNEVKEENTDIITDYTITINPLFDCIVVALYEAKSVVVEVRNVEAEIQKAADGSMVMDDNDQPVILPPDRVYDNNVNIGTVHGTLIVEVGSNAYSQVEAYPGFNFIGYNGYLTAKSNDFLNNRKLVDTKGVGINVISWTSNNTLDKLAKENLNSDYATDSGTYSGTLGHDFSLKEVTTLYNTNDAKFLYNKVIKIGDEGKLNKVNYLKLYRLKDDVSINAFYIVQTYVVELRIAEMEGSVINGADSNSTTSFIAYTDKVNQIKRGYIMNGEDRITITPNTDLDGSGYPKQGNPYVYTKQDTNGNQLIVPARIPLGALDLEKSITSKVLLYKNGNKVKDLDGNSIPYVAYSETEDGLFNAKSTSGQVKVYNITSFYGNTQLSQMLNYVMPANTSNLDNKLTCSFNNMIYMLKPGLIQLGINSNIKDINEYGNDAQKRVKLYVDFETKTIRVKILLISENGTFPIIKVQNQLNEGVLDCAQTGVMELYADDMDHNTLYAEEFYKAGKNIPDLNSLTTSTAFITGFYQNLSETNDAPKNLNLIVNLNYLYTVQQITSSVTYSGAGETENKSTGGNRVDYENGNYADKDTHRSLDGTFKTLQTYNGAVTKDGKTTAKIPVFSRDIFKSTAQFISSYDVLMTNFDNYYFTVVRNVKPFVDTLEYLLNEYYSNAEHPTTTDYIKLSKGCKNSLLTYFQNNTNIISDKGWVGWNEFWNIEQKYDNSNETLETLYTQTYLFLTGLLTYITNYATNPVAEYHSTGKVNFAGFKNSLGKTRIRNVKNLYSFFNIMFGTNFKNDSDLNNYFVYDQYNIIQFYKEIKNQIHSGSNFNSGLNIKGYMDSYIDMLNLTYTVNDSVNITATIKVHKRSQYNEAWQEVWMPIMHFKMVGIFPVPYFTIDHVGDILWWASKGYSYLKSVKCVSFSTRNRLDTHSVDTSGHLDASRMDKNYGFSEIMGNIFTSDTSKTGAIANELSFHANYMADVEAFNTAESPCDLNVSLNGNQHIYYGNSSWQALPVGSGAIGVVAIAGSAILTVVTFGIAGVVIAGCYLVADKVINSMPNNSPLRNGFMF